MSIIRCPHCGTANRAGSNFCNSCGANLRPEAEADASAATPPRNAAEQPEASELPAPRSEIVPPEGATPTPSIADQPWLQQEAAPADAQEDAPEAPDLDAQDRLIAGVQGLLRPATVLNRLPDQIAPPSPLPMPLGSDELRRLRQILNDEPVVAPIDLPALTPKFPALRIPWVFLLIGLATAIPIILALRWPLGEVTQWPGVAEAYTTVDNLSWNADVLVYWAYDPASAGELDLVALPVLRHLIDRRSRIVVISPLPNGPATARRLFRRAIADAQQSDSGSPGGGQSLLLEAGYLPGGASVLPLLGQDPLAAMGTDARAALDGQPDLAIVMAAQAEDVQQWVEQVEPLNQLPVVAVTSAGADPGVRPYFASGQLHGLVSGFDGAVSYQQLSGVTLSTNESEILRGQLTYQNWSHFALFTIIALGNLAVLSMRNSRQ